MGESTCFDVACRKCSRLAEYLGDIRREYPHYHAQPVAPFGDTAATLLIVGLAPGLHGANASGRPFTGDHAGILLYRTLHYFGFSTAPESTSRDDGLRLRGCRITNAVKCVPPQNKPNTGEIRSCNGYLAEELRRLPPGGVVVALGGIAHRSVLMAVGQKPAHYPFGHGNIHHLERHCRLVDSYHCSRYNTQTRRLTEAMFHDVFRQAVELLKARQSSSGSA